MEVKESLELITVDDEKICEFYFVVGFALLTGDRNRVK